MHKALDERYFATLSHVSPTPASVLVCNSTAWLDDFVDIIYCTQRTGLSRHLLLVVSEEARLSTASSELRGGRQMPSRDASLLFLSYFHLARCPATLSVSSTYKSSQLWARFDPPLSSPSERPRLRFSSCSLCLSLDPSPRRVQARHQHSCCMPSGHRQQISASKMKTGARRTCLM